MEQLFGILEKSFELFLVNVDLLFLFIFILSTWLFIAIFKSSNFFAKIKFRTKNRWLVIVNAFILALFYIWIMDFINLENYLLKQKIFSIFNAILFGMVINELFGISDLLNKWFKIKYGSTDSENSQK